MTSGSHGNHGEIKKGAEQVKQQTEEGLVSKLREIVYAITSSTLCSGLNFKSSFVWHLCFTQILSTVLYYGRVLPLMKRMYSMIGIWQQPVDAC